MLLAVIVIFGTEQLKVIAIVAVILSIGIFYVSLYPIISKLDKQGQISPKGYSRQLALTITAFMLMFTAALVIYFFTR